MHIAVEHHALHGLVVVKTASGTDEEQRLGREAAVLRHAGVPGVVELIDHDSRPGRAHLRLRHAGTRTALALGASPARAIAALGAGVATTLAALHARGISHNAVEAGHVLIGPSGEPVLCGLGHARGDVERWEGRIPFEPGGAGFAPHDDVAALAALLVDLVSRGRGRRDAWRRQRLRRLLEDAVGGPGRRPSAAELATALAGFAGRRRGAGPLADPVPGPDAAVDDALDPPTRPFGPGPNGAEPARRGGQGRRRLVTLALVTALAGGASATAATVVGGEGPASADETTTTTPGGETAAPASSRPVGAGLAGDEPSVPEALPPGGGRCPADYAAAEAGIPAACGDALRVDGNAVVLGPLQWQVGGDGDQVAVVDVDCDQRLEAALLRRATGELFLFERWASPASPATATPLRSTTEAAAGIGPGPDGCGIEVTSADGPSSVLDAAALR